MKSRAAKKAPKSTAAPSTPRVLVLFGAGSPLVVDYEETCRRCGWNVAAIVKNVEGPSFAVNPDKIVDVSKASRDLFQHIVAIPLFGPANRKMAFEEVASLGATRFEPLIDPSAVLPSALHLARGVYINAGAIIGAASTLSEFSLVNRGAVLGHHLKLGRFASIGAGVVTGGQVTLEPGAVLGTGCVVLPGLTIGKNAVVGAGAVVTRNVGANTLVTGNPARVIRTDIAGYKDQGI